jgi:hypothetical protein
MNGADLIPKGETIQVPSLIFQVLLTLAFILHLILMNIALGGSILNAASRLRKTTGEAAAKNIPTTLALAVNLGVPPLLFVQVLFGQFFYTSSVLMAGYWLAVVPMLILAYYAAYLMQRGGGVGTAWSVVSALFLLAIAFIYVNNMSLMLRFDRWPEYFANKKGTILNLSDPSLFPRFFHFSIGAIAVAALSWSAWAAFRERRGKGCDDRAKRMGLKLFWIFTSIEMLAGLAWLATLPKETARLFMGGSTYATALLMLGILLALGLLYHGVRGIFKVSAILLAPTMLVMVLMRDVIRSGYLSRVFSASAIEVAPQPGPLFLFLGALTAGAAILAWMIKAGLSATKPEGGKGGAE